MDQVIDLGFHTPAVAPEIICQTPLLSPAERIARVGLGYRVYGKALIEPAETVAEEAVKTLLRYVNEDPEREGLLETPSRVLKAFKEMTAGYGMDPEKILSKTFAEDYDQVIVVRGVPFVSLCEHHLLPFVGSADVGYLPGSPDPKVVGLSKLARLVECFARRLQIQERMTRQIADSIWENLSARAVGVVVRAQHSCMACRGVNKPGVEMVTSVMLGLFRNEPETRAEFLALCKGG